MVLATGNAIDPMTGIRREMPFQYTMLRLCRDVFHCTPSELLEQDWELVQDIIAVLNAEEEFKRQNQGG